MTRQLFFLSNGEWFEEPLDGKMLHASHEELVLWAYSMMERKNYRNYMVTENPKQSLRAMLPYRRLDEAV